MTEEIIGLEPEMLELQVSADRVFETYRAALPMPSSVFHYTSLDAAVAILRDHTVWCSNVSYSNDPAENAYGYNILLETVKKDRDFAFAGLLKAIATVDCYATSFSADPDLLPQWRAYCGNGRGIAVGVDADVLLKRRRMFFSRVEYEPLQQQQIVRNLMDVFRPTILAARNNPRRLRWIIGTLATYFVAARSIFKSNAYESEREFRLFVTIPSVTAAQDDSLRFRTNKGSLVPYFAIDLSVSTAPRAAQPITEIRIGPCLDFQLLSSSLSLLLAKYELKPSITRSRVQMRCD